MSDAKPSPEPDENRNQIEQDSGTEILTDADAADIVGRTGEEMPEMAHDHGEGGFPNDAEGAPPENTIMRISRTGTMRGGVA